MFRTTVRWNSTSTITLPQNISSTGTRAYVARGVSRFYPTTLPYMLEQLFSHFVTDRDIPKSARVWEGSRFCIDQTLPPLARKRIAGEIVVGYLEAGLRYGIEGIVGLMYPAYWRSLFTSAGWEIEYLGETALLDDGNKARAAWLPVSESIPCPSPQDHGHS